MTTEPKVYRVNVKCPDEEIVGYVAKVLRSGGLAVIPTDTVYGLAADPFIRRAFRKVYKVKKRDPSKPVPFLLAETHHALRLVKFNKLFWILAQRFWPGPLTIVAKRRAKIPKHLKRWDRLGVRLPACNVCREIARLVGGVIVGTSANVSGEPPTRIARDALFTFGSQVDVYLDGGPSPWALPSTVVDVSKGVVKIVREGAIPVNEIKRIVGGKVIV